MGDGLPARHRADDRRRCTRRRSTRRSRWACSRACCGGCATAGGPGSLFALYLVCAGSSASWSSSCAATTESLLGPHAAAAGVRRADGRRRRLAVLCAPRPRGARPARRALPERGAPRQPTSRPASPPCRPVPATDSSSVDDGAPAHRRLRRGRAGARVRHARLRRRRGRPARPRPRVHGALPGATTAGEVVFASKAFPCTAVLRVFAEEGLCVRRRLRAASCTWRCSAGFAPRADLPARQREVRAPSCGRRSSAASARSWSTTSTRSTGSSALARPARASAVLLRVTPGRRRRHARVDPHRPGRLEVRLRPRAGAARDRAAARRAGLDLRGLHVHIGSQLFDLEPCRRAVAALAGLGDFAVYDLGGGLGVAYTRRRPAAERSRTYVAGMVAAARRAARARQALVLEPGRALVANAGVTLYTVETVKRDCRTATLVVAVDGGMSDNLRPMLYGAAYEAELADRFGGDGDAVHGRRQALRVRRRARARRRARTTRGRATCSSRPSPAPTATRWPTTTTACPRPPVSSAATATRAWSCAARPTRTCMPETSRRRPARATARSARRSQQLLERARRRDRADHRAAARARGRAHALARRLRGDPRRHAT